MNGKNLQQDQKNDYLKKKHILDLFIVVLIFIVIGIGICFYFEEIYESRLPKDFMADAPSIEIPEEKPISYETQNNMYEHEENDISWSLILVNERNPIPQNYELHLVEVPGGESVDERIYEPLMNMLEAARAANLNQLPFVASGYRTIEEQQNIYDKKFAGYKNQGYSENDAIEMTNQWVAMPGYSEHHLGFAVDINGASYDIYTWLQENSYKYGFIFRYPGNKTELTGIAEEVWHYRYVGLEAAAEIYEQGICLEEYLEAIQK